MLLIIKKRPNNCFPNKTSFLYKIHPMFHISLMEFYKRKSNDTALPVYTGLKFVNNVEKWEIEFFLDKPKKPEIQY